MLDNKDAYFGVTFGKDKQIHVVFLFAELLSTVYLQTTCNRAKIPFDIAFKV